MTCAWFELLSRIPWPALRLRCCARHVEGCPRCRRASENGEALPPVLVAADRLPPGLDLWPGVRQGIGGPVAAPLPSRRPWRWAAAAAMIALTVFAGYWAFHPGRRMESHPGPVDRPPASHVRLFSAKIGDRPARVFHIQSRDPDRTIFWIAKGDPRS